MQNQHLPYSKKEIARGGWPEPIAEIYANQGGTPHLDRRHTVFGQLADEASYAVLDDIAFVETGAMDKPVEDVVIGLNSRDRTFCCFNVYLWECNSFSTIPNPSKASKMPSSSNVFVI